MKRLLPIAVLLAVMLAGAASAAGASAAQLPTKPFALPRWQSPAMPPALAQTGSVPQPTAELRFVPATVSVNDVDYTMRMDVFAFVTQVGSFTFFDVSLSRGAVGSAVQSAPLLAGAGEPDQLPRRPKDARHRDVRFRRPAGA